MEEVYNTFINQNIACFTFDKINQKLNENGQEKKVPVGFPQWCNIDLYNCKDYCMNTHNCIAVITGEKSNLTILDFDNSDSYENLLDLHPDLINHKTIETRNGFHIWFEYTPSYKTSTNTMTDFDSVDIRNDGGLAFTYPTTYKLINGDTFTYKDKGGDILPLPNYLSTYFKKEVKVKKNKKKDDDSISNVTSEPDEFDETNFKQEKTDELDDISRKYNIDIKKVLEIIDVYYIDNRDSWLQIVCACKNVGIPKNLILELSKKSSKFTIEAFEDVYKYDYQTYTIGTIKHFAKLSNETEYEKLFIFIPGLISDAYLADVFYELYGENYILQDSIIYVYHSNKWFKDISEKLLKGNIQQKLSNIIEQQKQKDFNILQEQAANEETIKKTKDQYKKCFSKITSINGVNSIASMLQLKITMDQINTEQLFDKKPYIFSFLNIGYDIQTGKQYKIKKEDYITQNTQYNYKQHTQEQYNLIEKIVKEIFPDNEIRKCYMSILFTGLIGQQFEYFIIANGNGRNGKGLINELFYSLLGNKYAYNLPVSVLTNPLNDNGGSNQALANMENKRFIISSEPDESKNIKLVTSTVKKITGDQLLPTRAMYSTVTEIPLTNTSLLESNSKPPLTGRIDHSVVDRIRDIPFVAHYTADETEWSKKDHYPVNPYYKSNIFKRDHRIAFFHYILDVVFKEILKCDKYEVGEDCKVQMIPYFPEVIMQRSREYCFNSDVLYTFIKDKFDITTTTHKDAEACDYLKLKDLHEMFMESEEYMNLDRNEKQTMIYSKFCDKIKSSLALKKLYKPAHTHEGKQHRNVLVGIKIKGSECLVND